MTIRRESEAEVGNANASAGMFLEGWKALRSIVCFWGGILGLLVRWWGRGMGRGESGEKRFVIVIGSGNRKMGRRVQKRINHSED